jgi:hypothetical protein
VSMIACAERIPAPSVIKTEATAVSRAYRRPKLK